MDQRTKLWEPREPGFLSDRIRRHLQSLKVWKFEKVWLEEFKSLKVGEFENLKFESLKVWNYLKVWKFASLKNGGDSPPGCMCDERPISVTGNSALWCSSSVCLQLEHEQRSGGSIAVECQECSSAKAMEPASTVCGKNELRIRRSHQRQHVKKFKMGFDHLKKCT